MRDSEFANGFLIGVFAGILLLIALATITGNTTTDHYRQGQIDALSQQSIKYELVENPDGSKTWELIKK